MKNKITTLGYFTKRLKDNGFVVWKIFNKYAESDSRHWSILVNPGEESVYITCFVNADGLNSIPVFEFNDGSNIFRTNLKVSSSSMVVIINHLLTNGVTQNSTLYTKVE